MKIGNIDFHENLKRLTPKAFEKFWKSGDFEKKTGVDIHDAFVKMGFKKAKKEKEGEGN